MNAADRWGGTPLDDAIAGNHEACVQLLRSSGARNGASKILTNAPASDITEVHASSEVVVSADAPRLLFAAAENDIDELIKLSASGEDLTHGDYDKRTACHLAASNGHVEALKYILMQLGFVLWAKDRVGNTPKDDAENNGHVECLEFLRPKKVKHTMSQSIYREALLNSPIHSDARRLAVNTGICDVGLM